MKVYLVWQNVYSSYSGFSGYEPELVVVCLDKTKAETIKNGIKLDCDIESTYITEEIVQE